MLDKPVRVPLSLSVFFPCYNEQANVENTTRAALRTFRRVAHDFEIIIVNDGSRDRTGEIAENLAKQYPEVRAVHNDSNLGYGGALKRGFRAARKPWVFYTDGDGQFDFNDIDQLLPLLERYDIVSAYRIDRKDSILRKANALGWTLFVDALLGLRLRDIDCAFKIFPRKLFDEIKMESMGALIDAEILARAHRRGYRIGQVGVHHLPRTAGQQSGASLRVIIRAFGEMWSLRKDIVRTSPSKTPAKNRPE